MPKKSGSIYYAHAICTYGYPHEAEEIRFLNASFPDYRIVNPAKYRTRDITFYGGLVEKSEGLIFARLGGKITAGVGYEVNHAFALGKPLFELVAWNPKFPDWKLRYIKQPVRFLSREATVALYRRFEQGDLSA